MGSSSLKDALWPNHTAVIFVSHTKEPCRPLKAPCGLELTCVVVERDVTRQAVRRQLVYMLTCVDVRRTSLNTDV